MCAIFLKTVGTTIDTGRKTFTVRESCRHGGATVPDAFQKYGFSIIKHKDLDYIFTKNKISRKYAAVLGEACPIMSSLMGANSIIPLGDLRRDNGKLYIEGAYHGETTRMLLFSERQARVRSLNLNLPAIVAIEQGYRIVDVSKNGYAIDVPELALYNLRVFSGAFKDGELRRVESEFALPVLEQVATMHGWDTRHIYSHKPGPASRFYRGMNGKGDRFAVAFGEHGRFSPDRIGVITENIIKE